MGATQVVTAASTRLMTQAAYARHLQDRYGKTITRQGVNKLVGSVIPARADKRIDQVEADAAMARRGLIVPDASHDELLPPSSASASVSASPEPETRRGSGYWDTKAEHEVVLKRLSEIKLAEQTGELLRVDDVTEAMVTAARKIRQALDALPGMSDELTAVAAKEGSMGVRRVLREKVRALESAISESLKLLAADADDADPDDNEDLRAVQPTPAEEAIHHGPA